MSYLSAGKQTTCVSSDEQLEALCHEADLVIVGEDSSFSSTQLSGRYGVVDVSWFGRKGPYSSWKGNDLIIQALTGMPHLAGPIEGPPVHGGVRQATVLGGITAYVAAAAALVAGPAKTPRRMEVSILEANIAISEMDIHFVERDGQPLRRHGINRFSPNGPVGIYPCKNGWLGVIATTPEQWLSLCRVLGLDELAMDANLATRELRFERLEEVEEAMVEALSRHTPEQWAELGRKHRVPMVPMPGASGILSHPIFEFRQSLATLEFEEQNYQVPRAPFGLSLTPTSRRLNDAATFKVSESKEDLGDAGRSPLAGLTIVDFATENRRGRKI
jgi:crotonobetainyl-CoA:carnitine CoA-transferase CaiB-like acyl-CoA transferase